MKPVDRKKSYYVEKSESDGILVQVPYKKNICSTRWQKLLSSEYKVNIHEKIC